MIEVIVQVVLEVVCGASGHLILWTLTLGRWGVSNGNDDVAVLVGIVFWAVVGVGIWTAFFR